MMIPNFCTNERVDQIENSIFPNINALKSGLEMHEGILRD